ncbi:Non-reducing end beta-L-arabinofuranosidase [Paramyrothecium foliicola]|nr:Non-reducing end beta-L-arabinofuranosidase [Paramyrothecium foliicola]
MSHPQSTFVKTVLNGPSILQKRSTTIRRVTVHEQLRKLKDTGRYDCFKLKWHPIYDDKSSWPVPKSLFWDSDVAKWIEGACYFLSFEYDAVVDNAVQELVTMIREAQQSDGYLNVYFTVVEPKARWSNIRDQHELYNAGHLIEAAVAHRAHYKNNLLIEPIEKYVRLIRSIFGPGKDQRHAYPGHPEIELALLRLHSATGNQDAYELARYFIEERGNPAGQNGMLYYDWEEKERGDSHWKRPDPYPMVGSHWYNQAHAPILQQETIEGHSVRALYLLVGVADLVCFDKFGIRTFEKKKSYTKSLMTLWNNMVDKKMYLTGGVGAIQQWEGFGIDYFLPQSTDEGGCYAETCAGIAVIMLAERLLHLDLNSRYADVMELCLYNAVMTAMNLEGTKFTYVNQLGSSEKDLSKRYGWFECACCPPNLMRLFGSLGGYLWDEGEDEAGAYVNVHLYTSAKLSFKAKGHAILLEQKSNWPWEGKISFGLEAPKAANTTVRLRIPAWCNGNFKLNPTHDGLEVKDGYLVLPPEYTSRNSTFVINIDGFSPRYISPHPYTNQKTLTLARGPIVYCVEDCDHDWKTNHFRDVYKELQTSRLATRRTVPQALDGNLAEVQAQSVAFYPERTSETPSPPLGYTNPQSYGCRAGSNERAPEGDDIAQTTNSTQTDLSGGYGSMELEPSLLHGESHSFYTKDTNNVTIGQLPPQVPEFGDLMDFPMNWLPFNEAMDLDYSSVIGSMSLNSLSTSSLANGVAVNTQEGPAPLFQLVETQQNAKRTSTNLGSSPMQGAMALTEPPLNNLTHIIVASATPGSTTDTISSTSRNSIDPISPMSAKGGLYATSCNGARIPCTIRSRRPRHPVPGTTPLKPVSHQRSKIHGKTHLTFPNLNELQVPINEESNRDIDAITFQMIQHQFRRLCLEEGGIFPAYATPAFPQMSHLSYFTRLYYENFDPIIPVLHDQITRPSEYWPLACVICAIGAQYGETEEFWSCVEPLHELARRAMVEQIEALDTKKNKVALLLALTLSQFGMLYSGSKRLLSLAKARRSSITQMFSSLEVNDSEAPSIESQPAGNLQAAERQFNAILEQELNRRLGYTIWLMDSMSAYQFSEPTVEPHGILQHPLPIDETWNIQSAREWMKKPRISRESPSLSTAVQLLFREKTFNQDMPEFSKILLMHGIYQEISQVSGCLKRPLAAWVPAAQKPAGHKESTHDDFSAEYNAKALLSSWKNASLDCIDVLHWAANGTIAQLAGAEHPTVMHLHFARVVLLVPRDSILTLATSIASMSNDPYLGRLRKPSHQEVVLAEREVLEWAQRDEVGILLHKSTQGWNRSVSGSSTRQSTPAGAESPPVSEFGSEPDPQPTFIRLDRPNDDEMVQLFVRTGRPSNMQAHISSVGDVYAPRGPARILREGRRILETVSMAWGRDPERSCMLRALEKAASGGLNPNRLSQQG